MNKYDVFKRETSRIINLLNKRAYQLYKKKVNIKRML